MEFNLRSKGGKIVKRGISHIALVFLMVIAVFMGCGSIDETSDETPGNTSPWVKEEGKRVDEPYFFDVCVVQLGDGRYRMYGELHGDIISYLSGDGLSWKREEGKRMENAGFPFVMELPDGRWRMYYSAMGIGAEDRFLSAISTDGLTFEVEEGHRYDGKSDYEQIVQSPRIVKLDDGTYRMYFTAISDVGTENETARILSAISSDGLNFTLEEGVRIDPTVPPLVGKRAAHAWPITLSDGSICLYFAGATTNGGGIISAISSDGLNFTINPFPELLNWAEDKDVQDPCVIAIGDTLRMYYGLYNGPYVIPESGIYSALNTSVISQ